MVCIQCGKKIPDGFVLVSNSPPDVVDGHSDVERQTRLFELATTGSSLELNRSICGKCTNDIVERLDMLIGEAESDKASYARLISDTDNFFPQHHASTVQTKREYFDKVIDSLRIKREELQLHFHVLYQEEMELQEEEQRYWSDFLIVDQSQHHQHYHDHQHQHHLQCQAQLEALSEELHSLKTVNVYLDSFIIGITQHGIGTINNLRLGRKSEEAVEWDELNAAWGQSVLLLHVLAKKLGCIFSKYRLIPMGARPFIQQKDQHGQGLTYPLHGSPAVTFSRSPYFYEFWGSSTNSNFDLGMEAFLFCVSELCACTISLSSTIALPY